MKKSILLESCQHILRAAVKKRQIALFIVLLYGRHAHVKPLRYPADAGVYIELANEFKIRPLDVFALRADNGKAVYAIMQAALEIAQKIRAVLRIEDIQNEGAVIHEVLEPLNDVVAPHFITNLMRQRLVGILLKHPLQKIVNIVKMIVEGLPVYFTVLHYINNGYLIQRLFFQQLLQRRRQRPFGRL